ncbi:hypothetical protein IW142_004620 [Coemansia sp. RSA 564]|nr:hypothetical protein IW142_004620 [Coemansia sp. RSA 564]KAJ2280768.1 hypothetical protein GGH14_002234 [Coemansia sp. RSA 370]
MKQLDSDGLGQPKQPQRRRSASELRAESAAATAPAAQDEWLHEELEAVGELKRGAIAAQFPEEFSIDSDILNGASNVWLPARLHPEIAPGEFQEWLQKHGSQLNKVEDMVNRRKSILSYSVDNGSDDEMPDRVVMRNLQRRNTTGLVRRKTFIERATEEQEAAVQSGEEAPYLVQNVQRSSLKRSKLANKRRDSTASSGSGSRRRGRRGHQQQPAVSSPLAPATASDDEDAQIGSSSGNQPQPAHLDVAAADRNMTKDGNRMSTAEILKQVTAAVDDFGFDDFELSGLEASGEDDAPSPVVQAQTAPITTQQPQAQQQQPATLERKTITHKKSGSWWQWGRDDNSEAAERDARSDTPPPLPTHATNSPHAAAKPGRTAEPPQPAAGDSGPSSVKAKLPSPISFLRFNRKSKKDRKAAEPGPSRTVPSPSASASPKPPPPPVAALLARTPKPQASAPADNDSDESSEQETPQQPLSASRPGPSTDNKGAAHSQIPSIITPVRPPPTMRTAAGSNRLPIHIERAIYRLASIKLANPRRPLLQQVLLSNMMFWYLELINPKTPAQPVPQQKTPPQQQQPQKPQEPAKQPPQQQSPQMQGYSQQSQQAGQRSGSPVPYQPQPQPQQQQPQHQHSDRRGKRGGPAHKNSREQNRRRSSNTSASEHVVMRSPQYERQQQQIYMNGTGHAYSHQSPPTSPQSMQFQGSPQQQQRNNPYQNMAGAQSQPSVARLSQSDEDDDVPLALYRGERNAMSIG